MTPAPLAYPFRIFFLSSAAMAALLVPLWALMVTGVLDLQGTMPGLYWHQHEMLAGLLYSAIAGFALTAVCTWTGTAPVRGGWLLGLWLVWLLPRIGLLLNIAPAWSLALDLLFLPLVAGALARRIIPARQWRQLPLIAMLLLLWAADAGFHASGQPHWLRLGILLAGLLILLVGGRITPAFSRNWLQARSRDALPVKTHPPLEWLTAASYLALLALETAALLIPGMQQPALLMVAAAVAGLASLARLLCWRGWLIREEPLLWVLHLGLLWVSLGLLLRGFAAAGLLSDTVWLHALGSGAIGTTILGVMARVSLGHTGRPLRLPAGMIAAFWLVLASGLLRVLTALNTINWQLGVTLSTLAWSAAFALFLWHYTHILCSPRPDGKPG